MAESRNGITKWIALGITILFAIVAVSFAWATLLGDLRAAEFRLEVNTKRIDALTEVLQNIDKKQDVMSATLNRIEKKVDAN